MTEPDTAARPWTVTCEDGTVFKRYATQGEAMTVAVKIDVGGQMYPFHALACSGPHHVAKEADGE